MNLVNEKKETVLEWFLINCRKNKTNGITLANHKEHRQTAIQSKIEANARENVRKRVTIGFGFTFDWLKEWREFSEPITQA